MKGALRCFVNASIDDIKPFSCLFNPLSDLDSYIKDFYHCDQIFEMIFRYRNSSEIADQIMSLYNDLGYKAFDPFRTVNMPLLSRLHDASHIFLHALVENLSTFVGDDTEIMVARSLHRDENYKTINNARKLSHKKQASINQQDVDINPSNIVVIDGVNHLYRQLDCDDLSTFTIYIDEERQFNQWCFLPGRIRRPKYMYAIYFSSDLKNKIIQHIEQNFAQLAKAIKKDGI